ncbi:MAG: class I SAM-dependent methyltransferase [Pseudomonadota bacterium]|nr:class I SAM-dependent methyltransferase [Pseudomonadota bacterium]
MDPRGGHTGPLLLFTPDGLALRAEANGALLHIDWLSGVARTRRRTSRGFREPVARALGLGPQWLPEVLDATAGLGSDAVEIARIGARVTMVERHPALAALLADALARAQSSAELKPVCERIRLRHQDALSLLDAGPDFDLVYLDPMFPARRKRARVRHSMEQVQALVGDDADAPALLALAHGRARHRLVVKRPKGAPQLEGPTPSHCIDAGAVRFDVYVRAGIPRRLG